MQMNVESVRHDFRFGKLRTEDVDFMAAPNEFLNEINGLRRTAAGWRVKRLVRQECDPKREGQLAHGLTLCNPGGAIQSQFMRTW